MDDNKPSFKVPNIQLARKKKQQTNSPQKSKPTTELSSSERASTDEGTPITGDPHPSAVDAQNPESKAVNESDQGLSKPEERLKPDHHKEDKLIEERQSKTQSFPSVPYTEPHWSTTPSKPYFLSVIKTGTVVQEVPLSDKPYQVFGRLPCCDVQLEHPSLSRYHAVLQYHPQSSDTDESTSAPLFSTSPKEEGFYVYDLGSTHGTFVNKSQINPRCYYRLRVGQMVKFGGSSRMFLLESGTGNQAEVEASAEEEIREISERKEKIEKKKSEAAAVKERLAKERENVGAMWGMLLDDVPDGEDMEEEEYELDPEREAYYIDDPKKALTIFFEREGLELEYETGEEGPSRAKVYTARVRLPIDTATGESLYAEASVQGKKKDAVLQCALNACRTLDAHDILRQQSQRKKRKTRNWEANDYYDSDEDTFLDRTGSIEVKRKHRMKKAGVAEESVETFQSLQDQLKLIKKEITKIEQKLRKDQQVNVQEGQEDELDQFMKNIGHHLDPTKKRELKQKLHSLKKDEERVSGLIAIARPTEMPSKLDSGPPKPAREQPVIKATLTKRSTLNNHHRSETNKTEEAHGCVEVVTKEKQPLKIDTSSPQQKQANTEIDDGHKIPPKRKMKQKASLDSPVGPAIERKAKGAPTTNAKPTKDMQWQDDADYSDWMPPQHQSGDGRTHLNEKYGY